MPFYVFIQEAGRVWQGGPCPTFAEAASVGLIRGQQYEVKEYNTRDPDRAKKMYNMELFKTGKPIEDVRKRHFKIKR